MSCEGRRRTDSSLGSRSHDSNAEASAGTRGGRSALLTFRGMKPWQDPLAATVNGLASDSRAQKLMRRASLGWEENCPTVQKHILLE